MRDILWAIWAFENGQVPWLAVVVALIQLFWFFIGDMLFCLLDLKPTVNISSSTEVFLCTNGLTMLAYGTGVDAIFSMLIS